MPAKAELSTATWRRYAGPVPPAPDQASMSRRRRARPVRDWVASYHVEKASLAAPDDAATQPDMGTPVTRPSAAAPAAPPASATIVASGRYPEPGRKPSTADGIATRASEGRA